MVVRGSAAPGTAAAPGAGPPATSAVARKSLLQPQQQQQPPLASVGIRVVAAAVGKPGLGLGGKQGGLGLGQQRGGASRAAAVAVVVAALALAGVLACAASWTRISSQSTTTTTTTTTTVARLTSVPPRSPPPPASSTTTTTTTTTALVLALENDATVARNTWAPLFESRLGPVAVVGSHASANYSLYNARHRVHAGPLGVLEDALDKWPDSRAFLFVDVYTYVVPEHVAELVHRLDALPPTFLAYLAPDDSEDRDANVPLPVGGFLTTRRALERTRNATDFACAMARLPAPRFRGLSIPRFLRTCLAAVGVALTHEPRLVPLSLSTAALLRTVTPALRWPVPPDEPFPFMPRNVATLRAWDDRRGTSAHHMRAYRWREYEMEALHVWLRHVEVARSPPPGFLAKSVVILIPVGRNADVEPANRAWATVARSLGATVAFVGKCPACDYAVTPETEAVKPNGTSEGVKGEHLDFKVLTMLQDAPVRFPHATWFLKADLDTFIIPENLMWVVARLNPAQPHYFGWTRAVYLREIRRTAFPMGGAGYVLNRAALDLVDWSFCHGVSRGFEDLSVGKCVRGGAQVVPTHDEHFTAYPMSFRFSLLANRVEWPKTGYFRHMLDSLPSRVVTMHGYKDPFDLEAASLALRFVSVPKAFDASGRVAMPRECAAVDCASLGKQPGVDLSFVAVPPPHTPLEVWCCSGEP